MIDSISPVESDGVLFCWWWCGWLNWEGVDSGGFALVKTSRLPVKSITVSLSVDNFAVSTDDNPVRTASTSFVAMCDDNDVINSLIAKIPSVEKK